MGKSLLNVLLVLVLPFRLWIFITSMRVSRMATSVLPYIIPPLLGRLLSQSIFVYCYKKYFRS